MSDKGFNVSMTIDININLSIISEVIEIETISRLEMLHVYFSLNDLLLIP